MTDITITFAALSDVGLARSINEDAFQLTDLSTGASFDASPSNGHFSVGPRGALLTLSDGMGGHAAGEVASSTVISSVRATLQAGGEAPAEQRLEAAVRRANADVIEAAQIKGRHGMGATLTAVLVDQTTAYVAEVGDSRAYLFRDGRARQLTEDHSWVQEQVRAGLVSADDVMVSRFRNIITRSVGFEAGASPDILTMLVETGDCFLLCSDGLCNYFSAEELGVVLSGHFYGEAGSALVTLANERGGDDNITCVCIHVAND